MDLNLFIWVLIHIVTMKDMMKLKKHVGQKNVHYVVMKYTHINKNQLYLVMNQILK